MTNKTKNNDFIELDFTAKIKETNSVFDTTLVEEAKKAELQDFSKAKSIKICIGQKMVVDGLDKALEGKEVGKDYSVEVNPKEAFGLRDSSLVKVMPLKVFHEKNINPVRGLMLNLDGLLVRISSVSGGRVIVDFNNPLSGKNILYDFKIKRIISEIKEKLTSLISVFLKIGEEDIMVKISDKNASVEISNKADPNAILMLSNKKAVEEFKKKVKELISLNVEIKKEKQEEKKKEKAEEKVEENKEENKENKKEPATEAK